MFGKGGFVEALWDRDVNAEIVIPDVCIAGFVVVEEGFEVDGAGPEDLCCFVDGAGSL